MKITNVIKNFYGLLARFLANFAIIIALSKLYSNQSLGQYAVAFAWSQAISVISEFGFHLRVPKELASEYFKHRKKTLLQDFFLAKHIVTIFSIILFFIICYSGIYPSEKGFFAIVYLTVLANSYINFVLLAFRGDELYLTESKFIATNQFITLLIVIITSFFSNDIYVAFGIVAIFRVMLLSYLCKILNLSMNWSSFHLGTLQILVTSKYYAAITGVSILASYIDIIWLSQYLDETGVARYHIYINIINAASIIALAISQVSMQDFVKASAQNNLLKNLLRRYLAISAIAGIFIAAIIVGLQSYMIPILFHIEPKTETAWLIILAAIIFTKYIFSSFGSYLTTQNLNKDRFVISVIALAVTLIVLGVSARRHLEYSGVLALLCSTLMIGILAGARIAFSLKQNGAYQKTI